MTETSSLEEAARAILYQYEHLEREGRYDYRASAPTEELGQGFPGWASDLLETALEQDGKPPFNYDDEAAKAGFEID